MTSHLWLRHRAVLLLGALFVALGSSSLATFAYDGYFAVAPNSTRITDPARLLPAHTGPRDPFHHVFPQRADLAAEFQARGVNPHDFTLQVPRPLHQQIHSGGPRGGAWNQAWEDFFGANPGANATDVYKEAGRLIYDFQLPGGPVVPYPR